MSIALAVPAAAQEPGIGLAMRRSGTGTTDVLVRLGGSAGVSALVALGNDGVAVRTIAGRPLVWRDYTLARVDARGLRALHRSPAVRSVRALPPRGLLPLDRSAELLGLDVTRAPSAMRDGFTGRGVLVADLDSLVDPFHPDFFHADAGWFDWIDVDGDGALTPEIDAIDLDRDGVADADERASVLRAGAIDLATGMNADVRSISFDPALDWIYLDLDGDSARSFGAGFAEDAPALGEPLFVPDDTDRDGVIERDERLVRLGAPKIRAVYARVDYPGLPFFDRVFERGSSLAQTPADVTGGLLGYADTLHATGVLGILLGGVPLPSRRWVGIAPEAEAIVAMELAEAEGGRLLWALSYEPAVVLHEYVSWTLEALDGSDAIAELIDGSALERVAHVCPVGNIGGAGKHTEAAIAADSQFELPFTVAAGARQVQLSLHGLGDGVLSAEVVDSSGNAYALGPGEIRHDLPDGGLVFAASGRSLRGTQMVHTYLLDVESGSWRIRARAAFGSLVVHGLLADEAGFAPSSAWQSANDRSTIAVPATADGCLAVGAIAAHLGSEGPWYGGGEGPLEVRGYSARGPRIDGAQRPDLVAPDNPWTALGHGDVFPMSPGALSAPHGSYQVFGGTSGAGPHVAGVATLLAESGVRGADALARLRQAAVADPIAGSLPSSDYGFGRLSAARALDLDRPGSPPQVELRCEPPVVAPGQTATLRVDASDPDGDVLEVRWDDDYDGVWEGDFAALEERAVRFDGEGEHRWKIRVRDATGRIGEASVLLEVRLPAPDAGVGFAPAGGGCACRAAARSPSIPSLALLVALVGWRSRRRCARP